MERDQKEHRRSEAAGGTSTSTRVAVYARVSTADQTCEPQLHDLRAYVAARGWAASEFIDHGVSGAKERRPALDNLLREVNVRRQSLRDFWGS